jgi:peroxiredoxin
MAKTRAGGVIEVGQVLAERKLETVSGDRVGIPDPERLIHLQFRRFAGCPICNLHLRSVIARHDEIVAAGIREVVVFHSSAAELLAHHDGVPFAMVADPGKRLYREFGVESSAKALLDPRAWSPVIRGVFRKLQKHRRLVPNLHGGPLGLPADFLIDTDGRVLARKYGTHAYDQWTVDELLTLAGGDELATPQPS